MFIYDLANSEIQLDGKSPHLARTQISEWSKCDRRMKHRGKEKMIRWQIDGQIYIDLKMHFVTKYLVDGQVLVHKMRHYEYQLLLPWERDHSFNIMTGLYIV